jgi:hypothetical protein
MPENAKAKQKSKGQKNQRIVCNKMIINSGFHQIKSTINQCSCIIQAP